MAVKAQVVQFGEWLPDQAAYGSGGMSVVQNAVPAPSGRGYVAFPSPVDVGDDIAGAPLGGTIAEVAGGSSYTYVGTATAIYARSGSGWTDVSKPGGYSLSPGERWEFAQAGDKILACCGASAPLQVADVGGALFGDLIESGRTPRAVHIGQVNGWPVLGHTFDDQDGEQKSRLWWPRWLQVLTIGEWTPDLDTGAGYSGTLPQQSDGDILKIIGGEVGIVVCERAFYRLRFVGLPATFAIDRVVGGRGAICAGAVVHDGQTTYVLDQDGFYAFDGEREPAPIGHGKVDITVSARLNRGATAAIIAAVVPQRGIIAWALPLDGNETPSHLICYSPKEQRWSQVEIAVADIRETSIPGVSWDDEPWSGRPLDQEPWASYVWDSPELMGGERVLTMIGADGDVSYLSGPGLPAVLETEEFAAFEPEVMEITEARPVVDTSAPNVTVAVGTRNNIADQIDWSGEASLNRIGVANLRKRGVYARGRLTLPEGFGQAIGISFNPRPGGLR